jgi:hypothetical protein
VEQPALGAELEPSANEKARYLRVFAEEELRHRRRMRDRYPDQADYWNKRIEQAEQACRYAESLEGVGGDGC